MLNQVNQAKLTNQMMPLAFLTPQADLSEASKPRRSIGDKPSDRTYSLASGGGGGCGGACN